MTGRTQQVIDERAFGFLRTNDRGSKPRKHGITEIRGPYYSALGKRYLEDLFETMGTYVDALKFAGGSFSLMPRQVLREVISLYDEHHVWLSTGGSQHMLLVAQRNKCSQYLSGHQVERSACELQ